YEIGSTFYITIFIILPGVFPRDKDCILVSNKMAVFKSKPVTLGMECHCLPHIPGGILNCEIAKGKVAPPYQQGIGIKSIHFVLAGVIIKGDNGLSRTIPLKSHICNRTRDNQFFLINPFFDKNSDGFWEVNPYSLNGIGNEKKITTTVLGHHNIMLNFPFKIAYLPVLRI